MATKYFCDRCGEEMRQSRSVSIEVTGASMQTWTSPAGIKDLCEDCCFELKKFLGPLPRPHKVVEVSV